MDERKIESSPLSFVVIGNGQVVDKYWLRSQNDGSIKITDIISLEPKESFRQSNPNFAGKYHHSKSVNDTFAILSLLAGQRGNLNIANVATSDVRFVLTQKILHDPLLGKTKIFIEKPYASSYHDIDAFAVLIKKSSSRLHFSGKYANGRAVILYPFLPLDRPPVKITGRFIEGAEYFRLVKDRVRAEGSHPFLRDGPELDLGFHLFDIIGVASKKYGGNRKIQLKKVYDLSQQIKEFEPNYGFGAKMEVYTPLGETILLDLQAGKADTPNQRFIEFDYGDFICGQEYTSSDSIDPVYIIKKGTKTIVSQHKSGYNYYALELSPAVFGQQTPDQQLLSLSNTRLCLEIKEKRLKQNL